jgi:hypothetical protein
MNSRIDVGLFFFLRKLNSIKIKHAKSLNFSIEYILDDKIDATISTTKAVFPGL